MFFCTVLLGATLLVHGATTKIQTEDVELGYQGTYDNTVHIRRNASGQITFQDSDHPVPVPLSDLTSGGRSGGRVVRVAKSGGDYDTIGAGLSAAVGMKPTASNRVTVTVYPGTYAEQGLEVPDYVDLVGVDRSTCVISMSSTNFNGTDPPSGALVAVAGNSTVASLTIDNTRTTYPSPALAAGWNWSGGASTGKLIQITNCTLSGESRDILETIGSNTITTSYCTVQSSQAGDLTDAISCSLPTPDAEHSFYSVNVIGDGYNTLLLCGPGTARFMNCMFWDKAAEAYGALRFGDSTEGGTRAYFEGCAFRSGETGAPGSGKVVCGYQPLESQTGYVISMEGCEYADCNSEGTAIALLDEDRGDGPKTFTGSATFNGGLKVADRVLEVAADGSREYRTIGEAFAAAASLGGSGTILVYPGTYATGRMASLPDGWTIRGVDRAHCILQDAVSTFLMVVEGNGVVSDLTFENTAPRDGGQHANLCVGGHPWTMSSGKTIRVDRCTFIAHNRDSFVALGDNDIVVRDCRFVSGGYDQVSLGLPPGTDGIVFINCQVVTTVSELKTLWVSGAGSAFFYNCSFSTVGNHGIINFDDEPLVGTGTDLYFDGCSFLKNGGADPGTVIGYMDLAGGTTGNNIYLRNCQAASSGVNQSSSYAAHVTIHGEDMGDWGRSFGGAVNLSAGGSLSGAFGGNPSFTGNVQVTNRLTLTGGGMDIYPQGKADNSSIEKINPANGAVQFGYSNVNGPADVYDWYLRRTEANTVTISSDGGNGPANLDLEGTLLVNKGQHSGSDLRVNGLGTPDLFRVDTNNNQVIVRPTRWKDWMATGYGSQGYFDSRARMTLGWYPPEPGVLECDGYKLNTYSAMFPISYEAGTVLTRMRMKYKVAGSGGQSMVLQLVSRDESGATTALTPVASSDSATSISPSVLTYDLSPDVTMEANRSYSIQVDFSGDTGDTGYLYSVGVETSKRVY